MAKMMASAMGTNKYFGTPIKKNIGMNTMQMHSVATRAGIAISPEPLRMASSTGSPFSRCTLMFSIATVASSTKIPTASASPPKVMMLMVSPSAAMPMIETRMESGMDRAMIRVDRQDPKNNRIMAAVSAAAMTPSRITPETAALTNND